MEWNTMHGTEFWKENAVAFEAKDFKLIRSLAALLVDESIDDTTLAIALHDLGEFAACHPQGRT
jgi:V-type H+-transporting ATPase subunit H